MHLSGQLVNWNDARGFGFIAGDDGVQYFVHIKSIARIATRPRAGDRVRFAPHRAVDGRLQARSVSIAGANPLPDRAVLQRGLPAQPQRLDWRLPLAFILTILILASILVGTTPWEFAVVYGVMGVVSYLSYAHDKRSAETGQWRTAEVMLLGLDLCCGIIGGLLAQALLRHKTRKEGYVGATILLAVVHSLWLVGFATGFISVGEIAALVGA